jgi:hypothetical protein
VVQTPSQVTPETVTASEARHFSLWPFGTRTLRLYLLIDPSRMPPALQRGLLRATQEAFHRSETGSLTNAVRAAVRAANFVLQHHNYDVLPQDHATAAIAVAAIRGDNVYVALVGDAAVFTWRGGALRGQRTDARSARPLGLEHEPGITLWSSPLAPGDRVVLVCGATWPRDGFKIISDVLEAQARQDAERELVELLSGSGHQARVRVVDGQRERAGAPAPLRPKRSRPQVSWRRWLASLVPLGAMSISGVAALGPPGEPQHLALAQQAEVLLDQAQQSRDVYQARTLAASARNFADRAASLAPTQHTPLVSSAARTLDEIDRAYVVQPTQSVRFGPTGGNVVDLAVGVDAVYTLDVVEAAVRRFSVDGVDQQPTPETLLLRQGATVGERRLDAPVAIQYLSGARPGAGTLTIVDQTRAVVQLMSDGASAARLLPSSSSWQRLGALGASAEGDLFVLDSGSQRLLEYAGASEQLVDPPRPLLDVGTAAGVPLEQAAEILAARDLYVRYADGRVRRFGMQDGLELSFAVRPPDGRSPVVAAMATDRAGGLYLADPANARIVHTTADGDFVRQLRDPALAGIRQLQSSPDGLRLYALVASSVLAFDVPLDIPAPVPSPGPDTVQEPLTPLLK